MHQQNPITHWPVVLRWLMLIQEVPKLSRLAIINDVLFGCPMGTTNKRVSKKEAVGKSFQLPEYKICILPFGYAVTSAGSVARTNFSKKSFALLACEQARKIARLSSFRAFSQPLR